MKSYYSISSKEVLTSLESSKQGLNNNQVEQNQQKFGKNKLKEIKKKNVFQKFLSQFKDILIIILLISALISLFLNEVVDSVIIFIVVLINAIIGVVQESKAENAMESLKNLTKPYCKVVRNGQTEKILTEDLTIGDIVVLEAGDVVPADLRLIEVQSLQIVESALTGESVAVNKIEDVIKEEDIPLGDQFNMAFMGTNVSYGRGLGVVVGVGNNTQMGKIASGLNEVKKERTPLQKRVDKTSKVLSVVILSLCVVIFAVGLIRTPGDFVGCFMVAVSIAVCAVPEGLPTGITVAMSIGVANMSKRKAIVKKLSSVETLGSTQVICSDKTGTLTLNKMTVQEIFVSETTQNVESCESFKHLINCMMLCNDAEIGEDEKTIIGDPTEIALVMFAEKHGYKKQEENKNKPRLNEIPFDSERKLMTTLNKVENKNLLYTKGAVDCLLDRCSHILKNGKVSVLTEEDKKEILNKNTNFASKALRVLGYAYKEYNEDVNALNKEEAETNLTFVGLSGMIDPPREEVKKAVQTCKDASIKVIMITGDHKETAFAIAKEIGIAENINEVLSGVELNGLTDEELAEKLKTVTVFARVNPEHKVRIVKTLRKQDLIVAMTGDGVNDAPSIKQASIGIGMGITGTDVTKDVADIILTDDNFATIVSAVEEGRRIYSNVLKIIIFLLSTCIAEVLLMFTVITIMGLDLFSPAVILWINIISDTFPCLALAQEKAEKDIMKNKPNNNRGSLFTGLNGFNILFVGALEGIILLALFCVSYFVLKLPLITVSSMCFIGLVFLELFHSYNLRNLKNSLFSFNPFSNKLLNISCLISAVLTILFITVLPINVLNSIGLTKLALSEWGIALLFSISIIPIYEIIKIFVRKSNLKH